VSMVYTMVEILYKVIAYIPSLNQIFDDKNKHDSVKGANNYQVCKRGILNLLAFFDALFLMIRKIDNIVISHYAAILFLMMTIRVDMQLPVYFNHGIHYLDIIYIII